MKNIFAKTPQQLIKILLETWKLDEFKLVGKYVQNLKNPKIGFFTDVRTKDYVTLNYPNNVEEISDDKLIIFSYHQDNLISGEYYEFEVILQPKELRIERNNPFLLKADFSKNMAIIFSPDPKKFIERRYEIVKLTPLLTEDQLSKSIETITSEINKKPETFIFELLQNSDDYPDSSKKVNVSFEVTSKFLKFTHTGSPFKVNNVHAICGVNEKDKGDDVEKIGFKGIGFKSVFKDSDFVYVNSGGYQFRFDEKYHNNKTFWQTIPIWTENSELDREIQNNDFLNSAVSVALRPKNAKILNDNLDDKGNDISYSNTLKHIFCDDRILLFLRHVQVVSISIPNTNTIFCRKESYNWWLKKFRIEIPEVQRIELNKRITNGKDKDPRVPVKFYNLDQTFISFAASRKGNEIIKTEKGGVFIYLPTQIDLKFPFLINGDFIPDGSREQLHSDIDWNSFLMKEAGKLFVNWLAEIGSNRWKGKYDKEYEFSRDYVNLIPDFEQCKNSIDTNHHIFVDNFEEGFAESLEEISFIPDYQNKLRRLDEILIDETGLLDLLGFEEFKESNDLLQYPIHPDLRENQVIINLIEDFDLGKIYKKEDLIIWTKNQDDKWFKDPQNNSGFLKLISNKKWWIDFKNFAIFIDQNDNLCSSEEIYASFGDDLDLLYWLPLSYLSPKVAELIGDIDLPIQKYNPKNLVSDYILINKNIVDGYLDIEENNLRFYRFLFKYKSDFIPEAEFFNAKALGYFKVWGSNEEYIGDFNYNIYLYDNLLQNFLEESIFPDEQFCILSSKFCEFDIDNKNWENFWRKFGVQEYSSNEFIQEEIIAHIKKLEAHFDDYDSWESDDEPSETYLQKKNANATLWHYLSESWENFLTKDLDKIQKQVSELVVFTNEHCTTRPLKECWLSSDYTDYDSIESLSKQFPDIEVYFISSDYLKSNKLTKRQWKKLFLDCGSQNNLKQFANRVLSELSNIKKENLIGVTKF